VLKQSNKRIAIVNDKRGRPLAIVTIDWWKLCRRACVATIEEMEQKWQFIWEKTDAGLLHLCATFVHTYSSTRWVLLLLHVGIPLRIQPS
jgi:hypothetical protein